MVFDYNIIQHIHSGVHIMGIICSYNNV